MPWHPPIPSEAVYSDEVAQLGSGLRLLWWLYNGVQRDGTVPFSPKRASEALGVPYETVRNWWQLLKPLGIVTVIQDKGKSGYILQFADDWLDWVVLKANYNQPASTAGQRSNMPVEDVQSNLNGFSIDFERSNMPVENNVYGTHVFHESSPPTSLKPEAKNGHKPTPNREMVMMLMAKGIKSPQVANEIAAMGLDYQTVEQSIDNLIADKSSIAAIVGFLRTNPPEPGKPYPRAGPKASTPLPTRPVMPPDMLTPAQLAERARAKRAERDTS